MCPTAGSSCIIGFNRIASCLFSSQFSISIAASDIALFGGYFCLEETPRKKRSVWSKKWLRERAKFSHMPLLKELEENEPKDFINYLRMDKNTFDFLLCLVQDNIKKKEIVMRDPVDVYKRQI